MFNLIKRFRNNMTKAKDGFYTGKTNMAHDALILVNVLLVLIIYICTFCMLALILTPISEMLGIIVLGILSLCLLLFCFIPSLFSLTIPFSAIILFKLFGKYGYCVRKSDWTFIKEKSPKVYKFLKSKKSIGTCYLSSWLIAIHLKDAEIMYLGYGNSKDHLTAHAVVVKGNIVYDTNSRTHCNIFEYLKHTNAKVFKIYAENEFRRKSFFDDIRDEFVTWCHQNDIHCEY